ncbi:MAG TPA: sulfate ABC transporter substrate-binding protein [Spongiibacteraceae bacterium]|nr:sulfate ABC transporter substrate-binding protein [Spongiibacteraceae bacterium]
MARPIAKPFTKKLAVAVALWGALTGAGAVAAKDITLLNVSYDPTRELYEAYNPVFAEYWKAKTGDVVKVNQSHGGSGKQARAVIDGLGADVVTLALADDINSISTLTKKIPADWQSKLADNSSPYTSTVVFLVRKGNPKGIKDWGDLTKPDVQVITPNPKTSGGARWNYLAAWGWAVKKELGDFGPLKNPADPKVVAAQKKAQTYVQDLYKHVPVLDSGARGSTTTFVQREIGDVLITWENEAFLSLKEFGSDKYEIVVPSISILAEPPVAVVDANAKEHGTEAVAKAYLEYLYSDAGQKIAAKNFYRPSKPELADKADLARFPKLPLFKLDEVFGSWPKATAEHFADGGIFDQIYVK